MNDNQNPFHQTDVENSFNLRDELEKYLFHWKWFVLCGFISISIAFLYLRYATEYFEVSTTLVIKDERSSGSSELAAFQDLGLIGQGGGVSIENEIQGLKSRTLARSVVNEMNLRMSYFQKGRIKEFEVFNDQIPISVRIENVTANKSSRSFNIRLVSENSFELLGHENEVVSVLNFNEIFLVNGAEYKVLTKDIYSKESYGKEIRIQFNPLESVVDNLVGSIRISTIGKRGSVLKLSMKHPLRLKAMYILDTWLKKYQQSAVEDKNKVGESTSLFVKKRLKIVREELAVVDKLVEVYKKNNKLIDVELEATQFSETVIESEKQLFENSTQLVLIEAIESYISKQGTNIELIPPFGFVNPTTSVLVKNYNELVLKRNKVLRTASVKNPLIVNLDSQLLSLRKNLKESLRNLKNTLKITIKELTKQEKNNSNKIAEIPRKEREYRDILRQQGIKEALYLYLLEKEEETQISLAVTTANSKVIDSAYGPIGPVSPKRQIVLLAGLLLGVLIPFSVIYLRFLLDTKLHTRKDVEDRVSAPILGDIPINETKESIVVKEGGRSSTAEAFRLLRTNLDFLLTEVNENCKSIFVTSTTSGEGKSFVSVNLACTLALSGKKVALVGMDLRAPKITEYLGLANSKGITNYIMDSSLDIVDLKVSLKGHSNLDIYSSGIIPPNPAELLMSPRVEDLFSALKETYDFIVVDTAPVNLVTDTLMIGKHADLFVYVARAGYLDKRLLAIPQNLYIEKRLPKMAMLINGSDYKKSYGYGAYGAYGYGESEPEPWWKKIFKI